MKQSEEIRHRVALGVENRAWRIRISLLGCSGGGGKVVSVMARVEEALY